METLRIKAALSVNEGLCSNAAMDESVSSDATNFVEYDVPASERAHTDSLVEEDSIHLDSDSDEDGDSLDDSERSSQDMSCDNDRLNGGNGQVEEIRKQLEELYSQHQKLRTCASTASTCSSETKHPVNWDTHEGDGSIGGSRYSNVLAYPFHDTRTASTCSSETKRQVNWGTCEGDDSVRGSRHNIALSCPSNDTSDGEDKPSILKKGTLLRWQQSQSNAPSSYLHDIKKPNKRQKTIITCLLIFLIGGTFVFLFTYFYNGKNSKVKESNQDEARMNYKNPNSVSARNSLEPAPKPCATFSMNLITDQFGNETTWELLSLDESNDANISYIYDGSELRVKDEVQGKHKEGGQRRFLRSKQRAIRSTKGDVIMSRGPYSYHEEFDRGATGDEYQMIDADICLPVGKYQFIIYDTEGDGICCFYGHGQYGLHFPGGREVRPLSSGQFLGASEMTEFEVTNADINLANSTEESQQQTGNDAGVSFLCTFASQCTNGIPSILLFSQFLLSKYIALYSTIL